MKKKKKNINKRKKKEQITLEDIRSEIWQLKDVLSSQLTLLRLITIATPFKLTPTNKDDGGIRVASP
jgi:hypothetical protein